MIVNKRVIGQDKNYSGKLSKPVVEDAVNKSKILYQDRVYSSSELAGFELNGGIGMTSGASDVWSAFERWCEDRNLIDIYNTKEDMETIKINLRNRIDNKNTEEY